MICIESKDWIEVLDRRIDVYWNRLDWRDILVLGIPYASARHSETSREAHAAAALFDDISASCCGVHQT